MKVTVIWSSPNKEGLTASAKNNFIEGNGKSLGSYEHESLRQNSCKSLQF